MKINLENYESWFLDYAEGNLTDVQVLLLEDFLEKNPNLKAELDDFEMVLLDDFEVSFPDKESLKKREESTIGFDEFIAYHEGDLSEEEQKKVLKFVDSDPQAKKDFDYFSKTYLTADESIIFESKDALLKKETRIIAMYWRQIAVAASILLIGGILFFNDNKPTDIILSDTVVSDDIIDVDSAFNPVELEMNSVNEFAENEAMNETEDNFENNEVASINEKETGKNTPLAPTTTSSAQRLKRGNKEKIEGGALKKYPLDIFNDGPDHGEALNSTADNQEEINTDVEVPENNVANRKNDSSPIEENQAIPDRIIEEEPIANAQEPSDNPAVEELEIIPSQLIENTPDDKSELVAETGDVKKQEEIPAAQSRETSSSSEPISALAFIEQKAASAFMGERKKKLRMFDVLKKIGDKSKLYSLSESSDDKFELAMAGATVSGRK